MSFFFFSGGSDDNCVHILVSGFNSVPVIGSASFEATAAELEMFLEIQNEISLKPDICFQYDSDPNRIHFLDYYQMLEGIWLSGCKAVAYHDKT